MLNREAGSISRIDINDGASIGGGDDEMWCAQGDASPIGYCSPEQA